MRGVLRRPEQERRPPLKSANSTRTPEYAACGAFSSSSGYAQEPSCTVHSYFNRSDVTDSDRRTCFGPFVPPYADYKSVHVCRVCFVCCRAVPVVPHPGQSVRRSACCALRPRCSCRFHCLSVALALCAVLVVLKQCHLVRNQTNKTKRHILRRPLTLVRAQFWWHCVLCEKLPLLSTFQCAYAFRI